MSKKIVKKLVNCARCQETHENLEFSPLTYPIPDDGFVWSHWCPCPNNGEPILSAEINDGQEPDYFNDYYEDDSV